MKRIAVAGILTLILMVTLGAGSVLADPGNSKKATTTEVNCGGETLVVVLNHKAGRTPVHLVGSISNLIPVSFSITVTDADGNVLVQDSVTKGGQRKGQQGDLFSCSINTTILDPSGAELILNGEATVFRTPRNSN